MEEKIRRALRRWGWEHALTELLKQDEGGRIICRAGDMVLKGIPVGDRPEAVIAGNAAAHEALGRAALAPGLIRAADGSSYIQQDGFWWYGMEWVSGRQMEETETDLFAIGQLARRLHGMQAARDSGIDEDKARYYGWFGDKPFKKEFNRLLDALPDWTRYDRCFVHTDLGPHNCMLQTDGQAVLIDLDDAGQGSRYLDLGWPFIMEFVDLDHDTDEMRYRFDLALAMIRGYYGGETMTRGEYDLLWQGAVQMHISYMQTYGPYAVDSLWRMLQFGLEQKEMLWQAATCSKPQTHV